MHHPPSWLAPWARKELESSITSRFSTVTYGHLHEGDSKLLSQGDDGCVFCMSPALFTRKSEVLGYSFITIDTQTNEVEIAYRVWTGNKFVLGTTLSDTDSGKKIFRPKTNHSQQIPTIASAGTSTTRQILESAFLESCTCVSSKRQVWVDRDISKYSESKNERDQKEITPPESLVENPRSSAIRAARQFGLTCFGRHLALEHYNYHGGKKVLVMCDTDEFDPNPKAVKKFILKACHELNIPESAISGIILDSWRNENKHARILRYIQAEFPELPVILLQGFNDFMDIHDASLLAVPDGFEVVYLKSLSRARVRELARRYLDESQCKADEDAVVNKLIQDIDALNLHRTPLNCLLLLKLVERDFDDSPVNRTQMIGNVLFSLFHEFDQIPHYSTRPDLKDCEIALGFFCQWLIQTPRHSFTKAEFLSKIGDFCKFQMVDVDVDLLFNFLVTEKIFVYRGTEFKFRHAYWLFYFGAQRMHHNKDFSVYMLSDLRYTNFPEIIEFYTGIDRMREDAVVTLTQDLKAMDAAFLMRTKISSDFKPFEHAVWRPDDKALDRMQQDVTDSIQESSLPTAVKDAVADGTYDRSKPYFQEIAQFITKASLGQMINGMRGAARALRNSDYVDPNAKVELLNAVLRCWIRMSQILALLSPVLAHSRRAEFDGMGFYLADGFETTHDPRAIWKMVMTAIVDNVVDWYQLDIFSKKLSPLYKDYLTKNQGDLGEALILLLLIRQRPPGWEREIESFIVRSSKNAFFLSKIYYTLRQEFKFAFVSEYTRQKIRTLATMAVLKHNTGAKHPNQKSIARAAKQFDKSFDSGEQEGKDESQHSNA